MFYRNTSQSFEGMRSVYTWVHGRMLIESLYDEWKEEPLLHTSAVSNIPGETCVVFPQYDETILR